VEDDDSKDLSFFGLRPVVTIEIDIGINDL